MIGVWLGDGRGGCPICEELDRGTSLKALRKDAFKKVFFQRILRMEDFFSPFCLNWTEHSSRNSSAAFPQCSRHVFFVHSEPAAVIHGLPASLLPTKFAGWRAYKCNLKPRNHISFVQRGRGFCHENVLSRWSRDSFIGSVATCFPVVLQHQGNVSSVVGAQ